jgi:hypothetical protein
VNSRPTKFLRLSRLAVLPLVLLAGCVMNFVHPLSSDSVAKSRQAVLIYGVQVEGKWDSPQFAVQLVEYSLKDQDGAGNCYTFNRATASVPSTPGAVRYFAFEVPVGHYTYGAFNGAPLVGETRAFSAVEGRLSYIGDFIYTSARQVELRSNSEGYRSSLSEAFPGTSGKFILAEAVSVRPPKAFLCAP